MNPLETISPIDGRYSKDTDELQTYFSEAALMRYRLLVEIEYLLALGEEAGVEELPPFSEENKSFLRTWYKNFSLGDAERVKEIEKTTNHDVKALEYFFKEKLSQTSLNQYAEFYHFALTSEDINNLAYSRMWSDALQQVYIPYLEGVIATLVDFSKQYKDTPMLALTHGQPATPTTVGKEFAVFVGRLNRQLEQIKNHRLLGKLSGATGTWGAHVTAYPNVDWISFSKKFIAALGQYPSTSATTPSKSQYSLEANLLTTQIESHDSLAESFHIIERINTILLDFCRDVWLYISRGILGQKKIEGEVGSSTMPHKINPIKFENAEGNLGIANALFTHFAQKLPISRMQRDLSDSTVLRTVGIPLAHSLLACKQIQKGLSRLTVNEQKLNEELDNHWEVLAEAVQTILRKNGHTGAYEKLKDLTRGERITKENLQNFIQTLDIPNNEKQKLLALTPKTYIGLSDQIVLMF